MSAVQLFLPYGASGFAWGTMPTAHNYTDQLLDSVMDLLYYGARYYDPLADQFVSADSVQGNPSGMNPYGYVGGNPETYVDPTGQFACASNYNICAEAEKVAAAAWAATETAAAATGAAITVGAVIGIGVTVLLIASSIGILFAPNHPTPSDPNGPQPHPAPTPTPPSYPSDPFVGHEDSPVSTPMSPPTTTTQPSQTPPTQTSGGSSKPPRKPPTRKPPMGPIPPEPPPPQAPSGYNFAKFGRLIGWGGGPGGMPAGFSDAVWRIFTITPTDVELWINEGVTPEMVQGWIDTYIWQALYNGNLTAAGRAALMQYIYDLLTGGNPGWQP